MKRIMYTLAVLLCVATATPAMADGSGVLLETISDLRDKVAQLDNKIEHKNDILACERNKRRGLERALRTGEPVGTLARCTEKAV